MTWGHSLLSCHQLNKRRGQLPPRTISLQVVVEGNKVSPEYPFLQTELPPALGHSTGVGELGPSTHILSAKLPRSGPTPASLSTWHFSILRMVHMSVFNFLRWLLPCSSSNLWRSCWAQVPKGLTRPSGNISSLIEPEIIGLAQLQTTNTNVECCYLLGSLKSFN